VRFRVRARDVALAVGYPGLISIRNRLAGRVTAIHDIEPPGVEVHLDVAGEHLVAAITRDATYALELAVGQPVTALVKATALDRFSFGSEGSAQAGGGR
jgi:molybdate transport system ATP-binding protein